LNVVDADLPFALRLFCVIRVLARLRLLPLPAPNVPRWVPLFGLLLPLLRDVAVLRFVLRVCPEHITVVSRSAFFARFPITAFVRAALLLAFCCARLPLPAHALSRCLCVYIRVLRLRRFSLLPLIVCCSRLRLRSFRCCTRCAFRYAGGSLHVALWCHAAFCYWVVQCVRCLVPIDFLITPAVLILPAARCLRFVALRCLRSSRRTLPFGWFPLPDTGFALPRNYRLLRSPLLFPR